MSVDLSKLECGDIIKTAFGIMIIEKINREKGEYVGHEMKRNVVSFWSKDGKDIELLNSDFRHKEERK